MARVGHRAAKWLIRKKFEQTLHFVSVFLLPFSTSKQISAVVLTVFQGLNPHAITKQLTRQLEWTDNQNYFRILLLNNK